MSLGHHKNAVAEVSDQSKYDDMLYDLNHKLKVLLRNKDKVEKAKDRIFDLYEVGDLDKEEIAERLHKRSEEIIEIENEIMSTRMKIKNVETAKDNDQIWKNFIENEQDTLEAFKKDILNLAPEDRKTLLKGMIESDRIKIYQDLSR